MAGVHAGPPGAKHKMVRSQAVVVVFNLLNHFLGTAQDEAVPG